MTVGKAAGMAGGSVPLAGESEIRQQSSATDVLTITMASGAGTSVAGKPLVIRSFTEPIGASGGTEIFSVDAVGNVALKSGGGLSVGGATVGFAVPVWANVTASAGAYTVSASDAGKLHLMGTSGASDKIVLPRTDAVPVGAQFFFLMTEAANTTGVKITASAGGTSDAIYITVANVSASGQAISPNSTTYQLNAGVSVVKIADKKWWAYGIGQSSISVWSATTAVA